MSNQATPAGSATATPAAEPTATTQPNGTSAPAAASASPAAPAASGSAPAAAAEPPKAEPTAPAAGAAADPGATAQEAKKDEPKTEVKDPTAKVAAVPEKYELKLPDGSKLGKADVAKVETLAREKGWSNDRAQEALNERHAARSEMEQEQVQTIKDMNEKTWKEQLMSDPDVGGQKFEQSGHLAYKAVERFGGREFADELKAMNLNHQPKLFKMLVNIGRSMESDTFVTTNPSAAGAKDPPEKRMYPEMYKKKE